MSKKADKQIVVPMSVDVDGAPTSYGPVDKKALDFELNAHVGAKKSGKIVGYLIDKNGKPIIQGENDPAPGFYISTTAYHDINNPNQNDPRRYVNAAEINYTVLATSAKNKGVETGDFCVVVADLTGVGISVEQLKAHLALEGDLKILFSSNDPQFADEANIKEQPETVLLQVV